MQNWKTFKTLAAGEARKAILSIKTDGGVRAQQQLHMHRGRSAESSQGVALLEFSGMLAKPARTPERDLHACGGCH